MKNYQLALSTAADGTAGILGFLSGVPSVEDILRLVLVVLSILSIVVGFIIKLKGVMDQKRQKRISDEAANMQVLELAQQKAEEAVEVLNKYRKSGKYRVRE